jgi:transposase-like protein
MYLYFVLWPGCSIREISLEVVVPYPRCYRFIRTVMEKLSSSSSAKLGDNVEGDEFYIKAGLKGRSYHDEIVKSGRKPRERGLKPWRGRGTFYKDHTMITCIHQRRKGLTYFDVPVQQSLLDIICNNVNYGSTVFTDEYRAYDQLEEYGFIHKCVTHSQKEYANGTIHVNNCECRSNLYQIWIRKFMGVNKYNLQTYSKTFQFIHNNRTKTRKERFIEILCTSS